MRKTLLCSALFALLFGAVEGATVAPAAAQSLPPDCFALDLHASTIPALKSALMNQRNSLFSFLMMVQAAGSNDRRINRFVSQSQAQARLAYSRALKIVDSIPRPVIYCNDPTVCPERSLADLIDRIRNAASQVRDIHLRAAQRYGELTGRLFEIDYALSAHTVVMDATDYFPPHMYFCR